MSRSGYTDDNDDPTAHGRGPVLPLAPANARNAAVMEFDKAAAYANALDADMAAEPWKQVRNSELWRGYVATIYGCPVSTDSGTYFETKHEALENARLFREQCREMRRSGGVEAQGAE